jgi:hypothetical protein
MSIALWRASLASLSRPCFHASLPQPCFHTSISRPCFHTSLSWPCFHASLSWPWCSQRLVVALAQYYHSKWDKKCEQGFAEIKNAVTGAPILQSPNWKKPFRGHIDASQLAVGGTLTQIDDDELEHPVAFYSKKLLPAEANYSANDRELLALLSFLQRFRCYLEGTEFEIFTDNQVLNHFFTKPSLSRREARWSEKLGNFGVFPITLKPGKIHVLGDSLSRAPHVINLSDETSAVLNSTEIPHFDRSEILKNYDDDQFFGPVVRAMRNEWPKHAPVFC